jgi:hypothetical protein
MDEPAGSDAACCDAEGWVRIVGFGSLLARSSAERSFPQLKDWRVVRIPAAVRVFGHAAPVFFSRGIASPGPPYEFASLCAEPCADGEGRMRPNPEPKLGTTPQFRLSVEAAAATIQAGRYMCATAFYVPPESMHEFRRREPEFTYVVVQPYATGDDSQSGQPAVMCGRGSDDLLRRRLGRGSAAAAESWESMVLSHGISTLWHHDPHELLPCRDYLRLCVLAAEMLGVRDNFLDTTFLADRQVTIRQHLQANPALMATPPPDHVRTFYTP